MARILVCDEIAEEGLALLRLAGEVVIRPGLSEEELVGIVGEFDAIVVRSSTRLTARVIEAAKRCRVIARAGVGVDNIDVTAATKQGILVVNAPAGNVLATAEHTLALLFAAARNLPQLHAALKAGVWDRRQGQGRQILGKTLGIIGLGHVGREVAKRARALGMRILAYDPYVTEEEAAAVGGQLTELATLLRESDFVSLHAVATPETEGLISAAELAQMKPGAILINTARGALIEERALIEALQSGRLAAAALDVFAEEPAPNPALLALPNVIVTPHVGAMTHEAQLHVARDAAQQVVDVLAGRPPRWPVNVPALPPEIMERIAPFLPLAKALGQLGRALQPGPLRRLETVCSAELAPEHLGFLSAAALSQLLAGITEEPVNIVNALLFARERHIEVAQTRLQADRGYTDVLELRLTGQREVRVAGALLDRGRPRIVEIDGYGMDLPPEGIALLIWRRAPSRPGFVGRVGMLLGEAGINILAIQVSREAPAEIGLMALTLEVPPPAEALAQIATLEGVVRTLTVAFENVMEWR